MNSFTNLIVWQKGHRLVLEIYKITKYFPLDEKFGLTNQLRRAAISITSNIAEGYSRQSYKEKIQFYSISLGSLAEIQNQLLIAKDIQYLEIQIFNNIHDQSIEVSKLLTGLIRASKFRI